MVLGSYERSPFDLDRKGRYISVEFIRNETKYFERRKSKSRVSKKRIKIEKDTEKPLRRSCRIKKEPSYSYRNNQLTPHHEPMQRES